ncbi:MAG TPA: PLP-dependent transferase [Longimicrobiales bacterium]|nr:PLP-dependent transferase [Longimicrobiales bacterium]
MSRRAPTRTVQAGIDQDPAHGSVIPPLHLGTNFSFEGIGRPRTYDYTRSGNPTRDLLADALADLEGGAGATVTASGMAAVATVLHTLPHGARVVAPCDAYGGTHRLLTAFADRGIITLELVEAWRPDALRAAVRPGTDLLWVETPSNPLLRITDLRVAAEAARTAGARLVVDNTFLSPVLQRPLEWGADHVVHSTTKYLNGHSDVVGGAVISATPEGAEEVGWWANCLGVTGAPFDAWQTLRGLRTLHLRMEAHLQGTRAVVEELLRHDVVAEVHWPGLDAHPGAAVAAAQQSGPGAMVSADLRGGRVAVEAFVGALETFVLAESLGGVESLVAHPATMTHLSMPEEARRAAGIGDGLLRFSIGVEHPADLVADVASGCRAASEVATVGV